jgi:hypothetical protein
LKSQVAHSVPPLRSLADKHAFSSHRSPMNFTCRNIARTH